MACRRFQPGEGPSRGILRDCTASPINRFAAQVDFHVSYFGVKLWGLVVAESRPCDQVQCHAANGIFSPYLGVGFACLVIFIFSNSFSFSRWQARVGHAKVTIILIYIVCSSNDFFILLSTSLLSLLTLSSRSRCMYTYSSFKCINYCTSIVLFWKKEKSVTQESLVLASGIHGQLSSK